MARRVRRKARIGVVIHTRLCDKLFTPQDRRRLEKLGDVRWTDSPDPLTDVAAAALLADADVGVGSWGTPCPKSPELVAACPKLGLWEHVAGTVRHMFGPHVAGRKLAIASCKTAIADNVAEVTLGAIILGLRRLCENAAANRSGKAAWPAKMKGLYGSTVGVIGASEVGKRVIRLLAPFGCRLLLYDPFVTARQAAAMGVERVTDLLKLCRASDGVTLHTPALPSTAKLLRAAHFRAMRDDAVFINTARGMCVDEAALIRELAKGRLWAFIDVTDPEPAADDSPLRRLPNVVLTSHLAGLPWFNMGAQAVDDIAGRRGDASRRCASRRRRCSTASRRGPRHPNSRAEAIRQLFSTTALL
jgi:phosphoglycerate dehydrogenase-like enzyme